MSYTPNVGASLCPRATPGRPYRHAGYDIMVARQIFKAMGLTWREPAGRYNHVRMVTHSSMYQDGNAEHALIGVSEFSDRIGCEESFLSVGDGPFDVYDWADGLPPTIEQDETLNDWWRNHIGEPYGYIKYGRMLYRALVGCRDWTKLKLVVGGFVCSSSWATAWEKAGRRLYERLDASIITPHLLIAGLELKAENWRVP